MSKIVDGLKTGCVCWLLELNWAAFWFLSLTLEIMTLQPKCEDVETAEGVAITVTGVAQVGVLLV